ncbi:MAG TPA: hypothetical protein VGW38_29600 [Chloroflexota bacterium]|nr:hypothetical protein [Chloroflexota bacterium]
MTVHARSSAAEPKNAADDTPSSIDAPSHADSEEPTPWQSEEESRSWRVRFRGRDVRRSGSSPVPVRQSVLVELDETQLAWLDQRAAEHGLTLAGYIQRLIEADMPAYNI